MHAKIILLAALLTGCAASSPVSEIPSHVPGQSPAGDIVSNWTQLSALQARVLIEKYGPPNEMTLGSLTWLNRSPWERITVWNAPEGARGKSATVEETVGYRLTPQTAKELQSFDARISCNVKKHRLEARSDSEQENLLLLNLANDIAEGRATVAQAKQSYGRILQRSYAGKSSPYLQRLLFRPAVDDPKYL